MIALADAIFAADFCREAYGGLRPTLENKRTSVQIFLRQQDDRLWCCFQGSTSLRDWITNFTAIEQEYPWAKGDSGRVKIHKGFADAYKSVRANLQLVLYNASAQHRLMFTGHSQGGALAQIAAVDFSYNFNLHPTLITFGQPKSGNAAYAESTNKRIKTYGRYFIENDPVPWLPLERMNYTHAGSGAVIKAVPFSINAHHINNYCKGVTGSYPLNVLKEW